MTKAYLSLGSNLGDKFDNLNQAVELLNLNPNIQVTRVSSFYETKPVGYLEQDDFINIVLEIETGLNPYDLLAYCNDIETKLKRKRVVHWGPRTIDADILLFEGFQSIDPKLTIPHPRMTERAFVIIPLLEIAPGLLINDDKIEEIAARLKQTTGPDAIRKIR